MVSLGQQGPQLPGGPQIPQQTGSRAKDEGSAAGMKSQRSSAAQHLHVASGTQHAKEGTEPKGSTTKRSTEQGGGRPARSKSSAPEETSRRPWQQDGIARKWTREGIASTSSSSGSSRSSKRARAGVTPEVRRAPPASLDECLQATEAADTPQQLYDALLSQANRAQLNGKGGRRFSEEEGRSVVDAAHMLIVRLLGGEASISGGSSRSSSSSSSSSNSSSSSSSNSTRNHNRSSRTEVAPPILQFDSEQLSMAVWSLSKLVGINSRLKGRHLSELVDAIAVHAVRSSIMYQASGTAFKSWSKLLYGIAKMEFSCRNSQAVQRLFTAGAEEVSRMLRQKQRCIPHNVSNSVWAFAKAEHEGSLQQLVAEVASNLERVMEGASPQAWANTVWALAALNEEKVGSGDESAVNEIVSAGVEGMVQQRGQAKPQELSNTLWALARLGVNPGNATLNTLATAMAERISTAAPQVLSNTLWALADLGHNSGDAILNTLSAAMAERSSTAEPQALSNTLLALAKLGHNPGTATLSTLAKSMEKSSSTAKPQELSNTLWALGSLRWCEPEVYGSLAEGLQHSIGNSMPDAIGQHFSNALFNCGLSCHFDSNVDALAAWGSQQDLQQWNEQDISNSLFAWAILAATAGGDTAGMRTLAEHLFKEASRRGAARFTVENDLGKLYGAHLEALHMGLPGGGLTDSTLLEAVQKEIAEWQQGISKQESQNTSAVATALQGSFEVQAAMVQGHHALLVQHNSRSIAVVVTQRNRDNLCHPAGQLYGKTALRLKHVERGCDGLVLVDESDLNSSSIELRGMLLHRI